VIIVNTVFAKDLSFFGLPSTTKWIPLSLNIAWVVALLGNHKSYMVLFVTNVTLISWRKFWFRTKIMIPSFEIQLAFVRLYWSFMYWRRFLLPPFFIRSI
jgi:hypothetical protein